MEYVIQKDDTSITKLAQKCGVPTSKWPEFCAANPKLAKHPTYGCVYYVGKTVNIPDSWNCAALGPTPTIPQPGPNTPAGPAVGPAVGPINPAPTPTAAGMFGFDTKTLLIGAGVIGVGVVAVYFLKKKSQAGAAAA